eukprot:scaffold9745_cov112-Isochrysis_galbana.AAC.2
MVAPTAVVKALSRSWLRNRATDVCPPTHALPVCCGVRDVASASVRGVHKRDVARARRRDQIDRRPPALSRTWDVGQFGATPRRRAVPCLWRLLKWHDRHRTRFTCLFALVDATATLGFGSGASTDEHGLQMLSPHQGAQPALQPGRVLQMVGRLGQHTDDVVRFIPQLYLTMH